MRCLQGSWVHIRWKFSCSDSVQTVSHPQPFPAVVKFPYTVVYGGPTKADSWEQQWYRSCRVAWWGDDQVLATEKGTYQNWPPQATQDRSAPGGRDSRLWRAGEACELFKELHLPRSSPLASRLKGPWCGNGIATKWQKSTAPVETFSRT